MLKTFHMVWARIQAGGYRLLRNDYSFFHVHINTTCILTYMQNIRVESNIQASKDDYEAATLASMQDSFVEEKAAALWICVQQQHGMGLMGI